MTDFLTATWALRVYWIPALAAWVLWLPTIIAIVAVRDWCERRWDRKYEARDALIETGLRELGRAIAEPRVDWHDNPQQTSREWALIQGAIYGADFQRWEREIA